MLQTKHNPDYKLVSITIQNKEFVYGETNDGQNKGLEVYHFKTPHHCDFYRSFRYMENWTKKSQSVPCIYHMLYNNLKSIIDKCLPGNKVILSSDEYTNIARSRNKFTQG